MNERFTVGIILSLVILLTGFIMILSEKSVKLRVSIAVVLIIPLVIIGLSIGGLVTMHHDETTSSIVLPGHDKKLSG
jgi:hypothetical protein